MHAALALLAVAVLHGVSAQGSGTTTSVTMTSSTATSSTLISTTSSSTTSSSASRMVTSTSPTTTTSTTTTPITTATTSATTTATTTTTTTTTTATTTSATSTTSTTHIACEPGYYYYASRCLPCTTSCLRHYILTGTCAANTGPSCTACDISCDNCTMAFNSSSCLGCAAGYIAQSGICSHCPTGTYVPVDSVAPCVNCSVGTVDEDSDPSTPCTPCNVPITFQNLTGQTSCTQVTICQSGSFVLSQPSLSTDRICSSCLAGSFSNSANADSCLSCTLGSSYQNATGQTTCLDVSSCFPGSQQTQPPTLTSDRSCMPCPNNTFSTSLNANCTNATQCPPGRTVSMDVTPTSDRICSPCPSLTFKNTTGQSPCISVQDCLPGSQEIAAPTSTSDRKCSPCPSGSFSVSNNSQCTNFTLCPPGMTLLLIGTPTRDTLCQPCFSNSFKNTTDDGDCTAVTPICMPGYQQLMDYTPTSDRVCRLCNITANQYQPNMNRPNCFNATICGAGFMTLSPLTPSSDRTCTPCPNGTFQDLPAQPTCKSLTPCPVGKTAAAPPSTTQDNTCICQLGLTYQLGVYNPSLPCLNVSSCSNSSTVLANATLSSDTVCALRSNVAVVVLLFDVDYALVVLSLQNFTDSLRQSILSILQNPPGLFLSITVFQGSVYANVTMNTTSFVSAIQTAVTNGNVSVQLDGGNITAMMGLCLPGYVSPTGLAPCSICPANTFSSNSNACFPCGNGQTSKAGSSSVSDCNSGTNVAGIIIGCVIGGVGFIVLLIVFFCWYRKRSAASAQIDRLKGFAPSKKSAQALTNPAFKSAVPEVEMIAYRDVGVESSYMVAANSDV